MDPSTLPGTATPTFPDSGTSLVQTPPAPWTGLWLVASAFFETPDLKIKIKKKIGKPSQLKITAGAWIYLGGLMGFTPWGRWDLPRGEDLPHAADLPWLLWDADAFQENLDLKKKKN